MGAAFAAAPASADFREDIEFVKMTQAAGDFPSTERPDFIDVVQVRGQFFALAGGQEDASCSVGPRKVCLIRYDWTEGVWTAKGIKQLPNLGVGFEYSSIATDGTRLIVSQAEASTWGHDQIWSSGDDGQTWQATGSVKNSGGFEATSGFVGAPLLSGNGFTAIGAKAESVDPSKAIVSTDGGANFGPSAFALPPNQGTTDVASDTGAGIAWTSTGTGPDGTGTASALTMTDGFDGTRWRAAIASESWVANLGPATYVVAKDNKSAYFRPGPGERSVAAGTGFSAVTDLFAAPEVSDEGVFEISQSRLYYREGITRHDPEVGYQNGIKRGAVYGNLILMVGSTGGWALEYSKSALPDLDFGVDGTGTLLPILHPPLIPPPDFPAVIDEDHSVIMPELGVSPKDEDGKPVMAPATATAPATRWDPDATAYCEWRKKKVACVSEMNPLPEATGNYTLKANLSGTSVSRKGACRWTDSKPQCRVWLTQKGTWRLTWSGENDSRSVSGGRTVVVK